ncbi:hypothetical protein EDD22DRAFT_358046 [Suillus occidentalis]|nr:hypothetical protein EDD22DRAFT_358046 [Suillus occidentalis]
MSRASEFHLKCYNIYILTVLAVLVFRSGLAALKVTINIMVFFLDTSQHKWECYPQQACAMMCHCLTSRSIGHSPGFIFGTCHHLRSSLTRLRGPGCPRKNLHACFHLSRYPSRRERSGSSSRHRTQVGQILSLLSWTTPIRSVLVSTAYPDEHSCTADITPIGRTIRGPVRASSPLSPSISTGNINGQ